MDKQRDERYNENGIPVVLPWVIEHAIGNPEIVKATYRTMQEQQPHLIELIEELFPNIERDYSKPAAEHFISGMIMMYSCLNGQAFNYRIDDEKRKARTN
ncbi:hypothetical protein CO038_03685 [Candidatus Pacearchaeota archaeon CG_4_9_14_0_2_um_filter_39_13]|nr:MAG: hypothetical protein CO038_03685 [Candidatus Pacearchaeota archaeon CG_4_9_14_0_2_um_filter_39_13]